jgi:hypothetical protein
MHVLVRGASALDRSISPRQGRRLGLSGIKVILDEWSRPSPRQRICPTALPNGQVRGDLPAGLRGCLVGREVAGPAAAIDGLPPPYQTIADARRVQHGMLTGRSSMLNFVVE